MKFLSIMFYGFSGILVLTMIVLTLVLGPEGIYISALVAVIGIPVFGALLFLAIKCQDWYDERVANRNYEQIYNTRRWR